jgi:uncharacterized protein
MGRQPSQRVRLVFLTAYVGLLLWASYLATGSPLPPTSARGLWFYAGFASLLLGDLLVSPYFTKPVDAFSNGVAALLGLYAVKDTVLSTTFRFEHQLYWATVALAGTVTALAIVSIFMKDAQSGTAKRVGKGSFLLAESLGTPRVIYSSLLVFSLFVFHREVPREYLPISAVWVAIFVVRPLETLWHAGIQIRAIWQGRGDTHEFGEILGHQLPRMVLLRHPSNIQVRFGDLLYTQGPDSVRSVVMALDHIASAEGRWLRGLHLQLSGEESSALSRLALPLDSGCTKLDTDSIRCLSENSAFKRRDRLTGFVAPETDIEKLRFEVVRDDLDLETGRLVEVRIGKTTVLYQVVNGVTKEEIVQQKHSRGFVIGEAVKIGCWSESKLSFDPVNWVPLPSEPVFLVADSAYTPRADCVGHFPRTSYPLQIEVEQLVTHNGAILGVLGSGKSFLAVELVERMAAAHIKTVCLDLTDQYAVELSPFVDVVLQNARLAELQAIGRAGKTSVKKNVEEGGSVHAFRAKLNEHLTTFLETDSRPVIILNPGALEIWKQDSKPFQDTASMATLSPAEITRIVTETLLEVLQAQGMTPNARCCLVLEEAHSLVPEWNAVAVEGDRTATNGTAKAILQGRKFGLGCLLVTQRTANVTKTILNQCNTVFALRCFDDTAAKFLADYLGNSYAGVLPTLEDRQAVIYGRASSCKSPILVRLNDRSSFLGGFRTSVAPIAEGMTAFGTTSVS